VDGHGGLAARLGIESSGGVRLAAIGGGGGRVEIVEQGGDGRHLRSRVCRTEAARGGGREHRETQGGNTRSAVTS